MGYTIEIRAIAGQITNVITLYQVRDSFGFAREIYLFGRNRIFAMPCYSDCEYYYTRTNT